MRKKSGIKLFLTAFVLPLAVGAVFAPITTAQDQEPGNRLVFQVESGGPIYVLQPESETLRYLTTGIDPALSPDGKQVAFTRWDNSSHGAQGSLWLIDIEGTSERQILGELSQPKSPVWSPDGNQVAISLQQGGRLEPIHKCGDRLPSEPLVADEDGDYYRVVVEVEDGQVDTRFCYTLLPHPFWRLRVVDVENGSYNDVPGDRFSYTPSWDPANPWRIVYDGEQGLVSLDLERSETWALTQDVNDHGPAFSPDGSRIAVSYWQHDHWEIHLLNADGGGRVRLTETPLRALVEQQTAGIEPRSWNNVAPAWSPGGDQLAFLTDRNGAWEMWVMNVDGSDQHVLVPSGQLGGAQLAYHGVNERVLSWR